MNNDDHEMAPADARCLVCNQPPKPEVTEALVSCHLCIGQEIGDRACYEAFLLKLKALESEGWQLHTLQVQQPHILLQPGQLPTFPVTFTKAFTILLQAPDRETAKEAIDNVDEYDLDYEWEVPDWEREVGIPCALAPECMVNDDGDIDPVGTRDDVAASNFAPHVPTTCPGDLAAKEVG